MTMVTVVTIFFWPFFGCEFRKNFWRWWPPAILGLRAYPDRPEFRRSLTAGQTAAVEDTEREARRAQIERLSQAHLEEILTAISTAKAMD
jgi:hypothetical protein